jgi:hypothetical protein
MSGARAASPFWNVPIGMKASPRWRKLWLIFVARDLRVAPLCSISPPRRGEITSLLVSNSLPLYAKRAAFPRAISPSL